MISKVDSIVRSCVNGTVSNVNPTEDGKYEIVVYYKNLYFWYYGVAKPLVKKGENVAAGLQSALIPPDGTGVQDVQE